MPITDWPDAERPREKLLARGAGSLSDAELLAIFLRTGIPGKTAVDLARDRIRPQVRLETRARDGAWRLALPADARHEGSFWYFSLPESGIEPLLRALIEGEAGIHSLSIERAGLHDAFVAIAGEAAAKALEEDKDEARR